jgi:hypothetical protein
MVVRNSTYPHLYPHKIGAFGGFSTTCSWISSHLMGRVQVFPRIAASYGSIGLKTQGLQSSKFDMSGFRDVPTELPRGRLGVAYSVDYLG